MLVDRISGILDPLLEGCQEGSNVYQVLAK